MALTESKLRSIIQEEARRVMGEGAGKEVRTSYIVGVSDAPKTSMGIKMQQQEAFEKAVRWARADFPGYEWELRKDSAGSIGMSVHSSPRDGESYTYKVYLVGHPEGGGEEEPAEMSPWEHIPGEEEGEQFDPPEREEDKPKWRQRDELGDLPRRRRR